MTSGLSDEQKRQLDVPIREGLNRLVDEYEAKKCGKANEYKRGVMPDQEQPIAWKCSEDGDHWAVFEKKQCRYCLPIYAHDPLLQQAADALRHIRLTIANWDEHPKVKKCLTDLIAAGY